MIAALPGVATMRQRPFFIGRLTGALLFCDQKRSRKVPLLPGRGAVLRLSQPFVRTVGADSISARGVWQWNKILAGEQCSRLRCAFKTVQGRTGFARAISRYRKILRADIESAPTPTKIWPRRGQSFSSVGVLGAIALSRDCAVAKQSKPQWGFEAHERASSAGWRRSLCAAKRAPRK